MASALLERHEPGRTLRRASRRIQLVLCTKENVMQKSTGLMAVAALLALAGAACRADRNDARIAQNTTREEAEAERAAATAPADLAAAAARKGEAPASDREAASRA
jgi:hypothetical protein